MPTYTIQQRIRTLSENAVGITTSENPSFIAEGIAFTHWDFNHRDGWVVDAWLAEGEIDAEDGSHALLKFQKKIFKVIPRISLIGQAYIQYLVQPYLIKKEDLDVAFFYYPFAVEPVGLMFREDEKAALDVLLQNINISEEFYLYWNDAVNTTGYSSKLLIMFAALDALIKQPDGTKDYSLRVKILGQTLKDQIFAQDTGLRHRLVHGEYFSADDNGNFVEIIHKKIIKYFNQEIIGSQLIKENIVGPQRNFFGNDMLVKLWLESTDVEWPLELKKIVEDSEANSESNLPEHYGKVHDATRTDGF